MESNDNQTIFITFWKPRHFIPVEAILLTTLYPNKDISLMDNRFLEHADFTLSQFYILNKINWKKQRLDIICMHDVVLP